MNIRALNTPVLLFKHNFKQLVLKSSFTTASTCIWPFPWSLTHNRCTQTRTALNNGNYCLISGNKVCGCFNRCMFPNTASGFHTTAGMLHGEYEWQDPKSEDEVVQIEIIDKDGKVNIVRGKIGDNLLYLAKRFEVEMEGACEASLACTTCHVYVNHDYLDLLPEATETEEDLLDQAPFLKENSRLGCQIILSKELNGIKLSLPAATKNFYVDGHKPTPH